jgi:hypothetical protein
VALELDERRFLRGQQQVRDQSAGTGRQRLSGQAKRAKGQNGRRVIELVAPLCPQRACTAQRNSSRESEKAQKREKFWIERRRDSQPSFGVQKSSSNSQPRL